MLRSRPDVQQAAVIGVADKKLVVGPEIYGVTAIRSFFGTDTTALEGLVTGRLEGTGDEGPQLRFKLGVGGGLNPHFGAPEERYYSDRIVTAGSTRAARRAGM